MLPSPHPVPERFSLLVAAGKWVGHASWWGKHEAEVEGIHCPAEQVGVKTSPFLPSPLLSARRQLKGFSAMVGLEIQVLVPSSRWRSEKGVCPETDKLGGTALTLNRWGLGGVLPVA